jgi:hypothetical protein
MGEPGQEREDRRFLEMAQKLRYASRQREEFVRPHRECCDRAQDDLRMPLEKRARIAQRFLQASYKADHVYEDCLTTC